MRHDVRIPALVVDVADAAAAVAALRELPEPLYVKRKAHGAILAAELDDPASSPAAIRVYRPRISESGELRYNHEIGIRVEFWRFGDELVEAPHDNAVTRRLTPASDIDFTDVDRYGRRWRTIAGMFDVHPAEFTEDVDMVFSWVDGSSTDFQRQRAAQMAEYVVGEGDDGPARYRHVDELRYALRSVHMYAPWVRRIFIATDSPAPGVAARSSPGDDRAQRGVLRRHLRAADPQLARGRGAAAPHRRAGRAFPLLERRHVLRSSGRAGAVLLPGRAVALRGVRRPDRRGRLMRCTAAGTTTPCA